MGCFLGCFGGCKDAKREKKRNKVNPKDQRHGVESIHQITTFKEQGIAETGKECMDTVLESSREAEEPLSPSPTKRVTFNSDVATYEPVQIQESTESFPDSNKVSEEKEKKGSVVRSGENNSSSGNDSVTSSVGSYPPNHRYQNCRESDADSASSDDEDEEDYDDYDEDGNGGIVNQGQDVWSDSVITATKNSLARMNSEEVNGSLKVPGLLAEQETESNVVADAEKASVRDRSGGYIPSVLNPVENLSQWKVVKSNGTLPLKPQKDNFSAELEAPRISLSSEPGFKQSSSSSTPKSNHHTNSSEEVAVDTSLSTWLVSPKTTPSEKATHCSGVGSVTSERSVSQGPNSVISFEDRPILGALTVEELKQLSSASSPRRSPSRSPEDVPIIGTVGTYWNHADSANAPESASSFKGIPNTTSKYREDKRVNWHSTPFETRLERALNRNATEALILQ